MRFPDGFLDELKFRCDIETVVSSYVTLKRAGSNYSGLCPFHSERTPSFTVFPATKTFYCFGCGAGGDVITFVMKTENLDYLSAVEELARRAGIPMPVQTNSEAPEKQVNRLRLLEMNRDAAKFFHTCLFGPQGKEAMDYITSRGLPRPVLRHFGVGYAPDDFGALTRHLLSLGYSAEEMTLACLCGISKKNQKPYDYFRGRVMFPIIDTAGNIIAFGGRVMDGSQPKYLNSSDTPVFKKSRNLYALNFAKQHCAQRLILCEGYMDVIAMHAAGFENAVATLGTAMTPEHARILSRYAAQVVIAYDSDEAGQTAAGKAIRLLEAVGTDVRVLRMKGAKDPDEYIKKFGADRFRMLLEESVGQFDFRFDNIVSKYDLSETASKLKAAEEVTDLLAGIGSEVERDVYLIRAAEKLNVSAESLRHDVGRSVKKKKKKQEREILRNVIQKSSGYGDRINPDYVKNRKAAEAEEAILGILLLFPEYIKNVSMAFENPFQLKPDDFITAFNKKVYECLIRTYQQTGGVDPGYLGETFNGDEMGRITEMQVRRGRLTKNDLEVLTDCIQTLRSENSQTDAAQTTLEGIQNILQKKRIVHPQDSE